MSDQPAVALVVGGSGDIGRAVASRLGRLAYHVAITGRNGARLEEALQLLRGEGVEARGFECDLTDETAIARLFGEIGTLYGRLDVVVNAAGTSEPRSMLRADQRYLEETLRTNLVGPALVARHALAMMRKAERGTIVNIASMAARVGRKGLGAYGASKGGLLGLSEALRVEAARVGVRVASISPEKVDTRMHGNDPERSTMIQPADVAEAVVFLLQLSPRAVVREIRIHNLDT